VCYTFVDAAQLLQIPAPADGISLQQQLPVDAAIRVPAPLTAFLRNTGLAQMQNVRVIHCHEAYGLVLRHTNGWKLVWSGDTRPCPSLIRAGHGATLLVHEATFDDELAADAKKKRHSTTVRAVPLQPSSAS